MSPIACAALVDPWDHQRGDKPHLMDNYLNQPAHHGHDLRVWRGRGAIGGDHRGSAAHEDGLCHHGVPGQRMTTLWSACIASRFRPVAAFGSAHWRWSDAGGVAPIVWNASNLTTQNDVAVTLNHHVQIRFNAVGLHPAIRGWGYPALYGRAEVWIPQSARWQQGHGVAFWDVPSGEHD